MFEEMMRELQEPGGVERFQQREREREEAARAKIFRDDLTCDAAGCEKVTSQNCSRCKTKVYCSKECQLKAWSGEGNQEDRHKDECRYLKACQRAPLAKLPDFLEVEETGNTIVGFAATKNHGTHFYVMEKFEYHGRESNRLVVLADTEETSSERGIVSCIVEACVHPEYDTHFGSGARRPAKVKIYADTFPNGGADDPMVKTVAKIYSRFGSKPTVERFDSENNCGEDGSWEFSWFCCHHQWLDEITDTLWLAMIEAPRQLPIPPNGMARQGTERRDKEVDRLDPSKFLSRQSVLRLPYDTSGDGLHILVVAGPDGMTYVMDPSNGTLFYRKKLKLLRNRRPRAKDVIMCIYKAVSVIGRRPARITIGQPSICILQDVDAYESALDDSVCEGVCMLAANGWAEESLNTRWLQYWKRTGQYEQFD